MATLYAVSSSNLTNALTWLTCSSAAESDSEAANTALTTTYVTSSTFALTATTASHLGVKVFSRAASPTGSLFVALDSASVTVAGTEMSINVSDIAQSVSAETGQSGWYFFKFPTPVNLPATTYSVKARTVSGSMVNLYSSATTNWSRELVLYTSSNNYTASVGEIGRAHV